MTLNEFIEDGFNVEHEFLMEAVEDLTHHPNHHPGKLHIQGSHLALFHP